MVDDNNIIRPGTYSIDYFSGAQVSVYIGHIWIDEVTSITYSVSQDRQPLYGYSDQLYRGLAMGQVLVRGQFSINFKEAGYLWVALNEYQKLNKNKNTPLHPFINSGSTDRRNVEQVVNRELSQFELNKAYQQLMQNESSSEQELREHNEQINNLETQRTFAGLTGFSSSARAGGGIGRAENIFEAFEDQVWGRRTKTKIDEEEHRRADDNRLNPFDIYITYGDFPDDNSVNHTIRKISDVSIIGTSQQVVIDGQCIQEVYDFIGKNIV